MTNEAARPRGIPFAWSVPEDEPPRLVEWLARSGKTSLVWPVIYRPVQWILFGLIGWLSFISAANSAWRGDSLAAVLALATLVGILWYLSRGSAERRWRAALVAYVNHEQAKRTNSRRNIHARSQSQNR